MAGKQHDSQCFYGLEELWVLFVCRDEDPADIYSSGLKYSLANAIDSPLVAVQLGQTVFVLLADPLGCAISYMNGDELRVKQDQSAVVFRHVSI